MRLYLLAGVSLLLMALPMQAETADLTSPLPARNLYPPMMRFFAPTPDSALRAYDKAWVLELNQHYASVNLYDRLPDSQLLVDMELYVFDTVIRSAINSSMELSIRAPVLAPVSGVFDAPIQTFHRWFNMPNGGREYRPNNSYAYAFDNGKGVSWHSSNRLELGNIELSGRFQLLEGKHWAVAYWPLVVFGPFFCCEA